jgi:predicted phosphoadenosine phosphosulfate sulfurtransferase
MALSIDNLSKPSSKKWKTVADIFLYTMPLYLTTIMALPIKEDLKLWINFGITMLTITLKAVSKFTSEDIGQ